MLHFLWMCIIGLIAGALAKLIMPGKDPGGILITMLLGIAGSLVAGFLGRALGHHSSGNLPHGKEESSQTVTRALVEHYCKRAKSASSCLSASLKRACS
jgi:uncharacterized membrane protein YeaQ/YmgE (transglycosylase-associated protein family)